MMLTRAGEYAVRCVLYLSLQDRERIVPKKEIIEAMGLPDAYLAKVAQSLAKSGLIQIRQGARGGYRLTRKPYEINLLQVVEAVDGEIFLNECVMSPDSCLRSPLCGVHQIWQKARQRLRDTLAEADFEQLARGEFCKK
ncbi:RrF2 family transcriptional regulator [Desulfonatronovibrio hydrogenovorans]|uniref:RrF2 family transcriptional regulator n=1 Tax=Desulfonatronovibrio hydrogenovorans TaxID=53245 RepID=UPI0005557C93|nr:Rrf2 family transcriptional regulator [Desulfonatronovibrio hydrogenovorans]